jgi:HAE1 family hydrophobic/amphiphilic exporter-1/multidrug efflux pump
VTKGGSDFLMIVALASDPSVTGTRSAHFHHLAGFHQPHRRRRRVQTLGSGYAMRIWLDPALLEKYALMPSDVSSALEAQNTEVSAGQLGGLPAIKGQQLNATIGARSKLQTAEEFRNVVVKSNSDGAVVLLGDVAPWSGELRHQYRPQRQARRCHGCAVGGRRQRAERRQGGQGQAQRNGAVLPERNAT